MNMYTIRDAAAQYFMPIFLAKTDAQAARMFSESMGMNRTHKADYVLFRVGSFDSDNGTVTSTDPEMVLAGMSLPDDENGLIMKGENQ